MILTENYRKQLIKEEQRNARAERKLERARDRYEKRKEARELKRYEKVLDKGLRNKL